jgi:KTSC domain
VYRVPVSSTNLATVGYDATSLVLEVQFHDGGVYQYRGVPSNIHQGLLTAASPGAYLARHIKGRYSYTRVG